MTAPRTTKVRSSGVGSLWQVPTIVVSLALAIAGIVHALNRSSERDVDAALAEVRNLIAEGAHDDAHAALAARVEPDLIEASSAQQGAYHLLMAELAYARQSVIDPVTKAHAVVEHYAKAEAMGVRLEPKQHERWAHALIVMGELDGVRQRLEVLGASPDAATSVSSGVRHQRVLERLIDTALLDDEPPFEKLQVLLREFRDRSTDASEEAWAAAQQSRLLLAAGAAERCIDTLLVEIRRLEGRTAPPDDAQFAGLFLVLGRAYYEQGRLDDAETNLERAVDRFAGRGDGLAEARLLLGQIALARNDDESALDSFDTIIRGTPPRDALLVALLGRAEARSALGDHAGAAADDERLLDAATRGHIGPKLAPIVTESLLRRHDAALAGGDVDRARSLAERVERLHETGAAPPAVVARLADSRRTIAQLLADAEATKPEAREHYRAAADLYLEHARLLRPAPESERSWADSLWHAGDCYDLGGALGSAIEVFREYIAGRGDEPRRAEALYRLAQCDRAVGNHDRALEALQRLIAEHPRSPFATRAHVMLARCYVELGRRSEAIQHLESVLRGQQALMPDAVDYRDALIELGVIHHESGDYPSAIARLSEAAERYGGDRRHEEIRFRLADSYRMQAGELDRRLERPLALLGKERTRWQALRIEHLERAAVIFDDVAHRLDEPGRRLSDSDRQLRRLCVLYRADCAYHLGRYPEALDLYKVVARQYVDHHCAMFALVQIVNCHHHLGNRRAAAVAHERALARLEQMPPEVFDDPEALLDREAWRRWLEHSPPPTETLHASAGSG